MKSTDRIRRARRWSIFALLALAMGLVATQPNVASETQDEYWRRTAECLSLFFSDPRQHALECVGDNERDRPSTLAPGVPYSPPSTIPSEEDPCPPLQGGGGGIANTLSFAGGGQVGGGSDDGCDDDSLQISSFVFDLFLSDQLQRANI